MPVRQHAVPGFTGSEFRGGLRGDVVTARMKLSGCALMAAVLAAGPVVAAEPTVDPKVFAQVEKNIVDLDSPDLAVREKATRELSDVRACHLSLVQGRLFDAGLSEEQRLRLHAAGYELFTGSVRAAMGVQFDSTPQGVVILRTIEGFDSRVMLRPEDVVRTIGGRPTVDQDNARALIVSHDPGDEVPIGLLRNGEPLTVTIRMGRYDLLNNRQGVGPDERTFRQAWRARLARLARQAAAQIPAPIDAVQAPAEEEDFEFALALQRAGPRLGEPFNDGFASSTLVAGGEPRGGSGWNLPGYAGGPRGAFGAPADPVVEWLRELNIVRRSILELQDVLVEVRASVEDPNTPAARRQQLLVQQQLLEVQLHEFEQQARQIQQRLAQGRQPGQAVP